MEPLLRTKNVFLFVPNLIGYVRIVLLIVAIWFMRDYYGISGFCYGISAALDMLDGYAARVFNQTSRLGGLLDMLTDRCATLALIMTLVTLYPSWSFPLILSSLVDISAHWLHCLVSVLKGMVSHKSGLDTSLPYILRFYYENRTFLTFMCLVNEAFYGSLYISYFTPGPGYVFYILTTITLPFALFKTSLALLQGYYAVLEVVHIDTQERAKAKE